MKFSVDTKTLKSVTGAAIRTASKRTTIDALNCFKLVANADKKQVKISAANNDLFLDQKIDAEVEKDGSCLVPAQLFNETVSKLGGELTIEKRGKKLYISTADEKTKLNMVTKDVDEFPQLPATKGDNAVTLKKDAFTDAVNKTVFAACGDITKGAITGVLFEVNEEGLTAVALDGFRMSKVKEEVEGGKPSSFIIPATTLGDLSKVLGNAEDEEIAITNGERNVKIEMENVKITLIPISGSFIAYENLFPSDHRTKVVVDRKELFSAVDRSTLLSYSDLTNRHNVVKFDISPGKIKVSSVSESGELDEVVSADVTGSELTIGFNSKYIIEGLRRVTDEKIIMEFQSEINPLVMYPESDPEFKQLILPVRLKR